MITHTVERSEICYKDIQSYVKYGDKITEHACGYGDITDQHEKMQISVRGLTHWRFRDEIRFGLYINNLGQGEATQNFFK